VLNDLVGAHQAIIEQSSPRNLGLAHMRHLVVTISSNSSVDDGLNDSLGVIKICSRSGIGFFVEGI